MSNPLHDVHFRIGEPIGAAQRKVKRATRFAERSQDRFVPTEMPDFTFDLNHINDVFGSDMVKEWFFRYVRRNARPEWCGWFQGTYL